MVKNSDVLFGRLTSTYQFVSREDIKTSVMEVSTLRVLGINKNISQLLYEKGLLNEDQIFAIYYSLIRSQFIKKVRNYRVCKFTEDDNNIICNAMGIVEGNLEESIENLHKVEDFNQKFGVSIDNIIVCLDIQKKLINSQINLSLINIIFYKKLFTPEMEKLIPQVDSKKHLLNIAKGFDSHRIKKCISILLNQIVIINKKMPSEQCSEIFAKWEFVYSLGLHLKYLELLFCLGFLNREDCEKVALSLKKISNIDHELRFDVFLLNDNERTFFEKFREQKLLKDGLVKEGEEIQVKLKEIQIDLGLPEILILKGHLKKETLAKKWADSRRLELIKEIEISDKVEEKPFSSKSEDPWDGVRDKIRDPQEIMETEEFEKELDETFRSSQVTQRLALQNEIKSLRQKLKGANPLEIKTINTIIEHYQKAHKTLQLSFWGVTIAVFFIFLGIFIAFHQNVKIDNTKNIDSDNDAVKKESEKRSLEILYEKLQSAIRNYRFEEVYAIYLDIISKNPNSIDNDKLFLRANEFKMQQRLMDALKISINNERIVVTLDKRTVYLMEIQKEFFNTITIENQEIKFVRRENIAPEELYNIFVKYSLDVRFPWEMAIFCYEYKLPDFAKKCLILFAEKFPNEAFSAWKLYASKRGFPLPPGGYVVYQNDLVSKEEYEEIQVHLKKNIDTVVKKETVKEIEKDPSILWENKQKNSLRERRMDYSRYAQDVSMVFYNDRWTNTTIKEREEEFRKNREEGLIFFNNEWHQEKDIGSWHEVILRREKLVGYLQKTADNLYTLRTDTVTRYLNSSQIVKKIRRSSPWERFWDIYSKINNESVLMNYDFGEWCSENELAFFGRAQFEKVVSIAPNDSKSRNRLGFLFVNGDWQRNVNQNSLMVSFYEKQLSKIYARYLGIVIRKEKALPEFLALIEQDSIPSDDLAKNILGGEPKNISEERWRLFYNFEEDMLLGRWRNVTHGKKGTLPAILNGYLEVNSENIELQMAYLDIPFMGNLQVRYEGQIAPNHSYDLRTRIYQENDADIDGGYLFALNWREDLNSKNRKNILQVYQNNRFEVIAQSSSPNLPSGKWNKISITTSNDYVSLDINGSRILRSTNNNTMNKGGMSFGTYASRVRFDDIIILANIPSAWYLNEVEKLKTDMQKQNLRKDNWLYGLPINQGIFFSQINAATKNLYLRCYQMMVEKKYNKAWQIISDLLTDNPKNAFFLLTRARIYCEVKNYERAIEDATRAIQIVRDETKSKDEVYTMYIIRGLAQQFLHRYEEARNDYVYAQTLAPDELLPYYMLANIFLKMNDEIKAFSTLRDYIQINKKDTLAQELFTSLENNMIKPDTSYEMDNYVVQGNIEKEECIVIGDYLQKFKDSFDKITGYKQNNIKLQVWLYKSIQKWKEYADFSLFLSEKEAHVFYNYTISKIEGSIDIHPDIFYSNLRKSAAIQLVEEQNLRIPVWFKEGLIKYFGYGEKISLYEYLKILDVLQDEDSHLYSLKNVALLKSDDYYLPRELNLYKNLSYTWTYFLIQKPENLKLLQKYLRQTIDGGDIEKAFDTTLGQSIDSLEKDFVSFWKNIEWKNIK